MPLVSVVVPNYNHARYLRQRIDTILAQTYQDFELILLDDASTDQSRAILKEYAYDPRVRIEFNEKNSGSTFKQWNKGVGLACGEYIWIAESDDYAEPRFLERLISLLESDPAVAFAYCRSWRVTADGSDGFAESELPVPDRWTSDFCVDGTEMFRQFFVRTNAVRTASAVVFRKRRYEEAGGADETLRLSGDWKLWAQMSLSGKVAFLCEPLNFHRYHQSSVRGKMACSGANVLEELDVWRWALESVQLPPDSRREIQKFAAYYWVPTVLSLHSRISLKRAILHRARDLDPQYLRKVPGPVWNALRMKVRRHWRDLQSVFEARTSR